MYLKILTLLSFLNLINAKPYINNPRSFYGEHVKWRFGGWKPILPRNPQFHSEEDQQHSSSFQEASVVPAQISNPIEASSSSEYQTSLPVTSPFSVFEANSYGYPTSAYTVHSIKPLSTHSFIVPASNLTYDNVHQFTILPANISEFSGNHYKVEIDSLEVSNIPSLNILEKDTQSQSSQVHYVTNKVEKHNYPSTLSPQNNSWKYITVPVAVETDTEKILNSNDIKDIQKEILKVIPGVDEKTVEGALREGVKILEIDGSYKPLHFNSHGYPINVISGHAPVFKLEEKKRISDVLRPLLQKLRYPIRNYQAAVDPRNLNVIHLIANRKNLPAILTIDQLLNAKSNNKPKQLQDSPHHKGFNLRQKFSSFSRSKIPYMNHHHYFQHNSRPLLHHFHQQPRQRQNQHSNTQPYQKLQQQPRYHHPQHHHHSHQSPQFLNQPSQKQQNYAHNYFNVIEKNRPYGYPRDKLGLIPSFIKSNQVHPLNTIELPPGYQVLKEHLLEHPSQIPKPSSEYTSSTPPSLSSSLSSYSSSSSSSSSSSPSSSPLFPSSSYFTSSSFHSSYQTGLAQPTGPIVPEVNYANENSQNLVPLQNEQPIFMDYNFYNPSVDYNKEPIEKSQKNYLQNQQQINHDYNFGYLQENVYPNSYKETNYQEEKEYSPSLQQNSVNLHQVDNRANFSADFQPAMGNYHNYLPVTNQYNQTNFVQTENIHYDNIDPTLNHNKQSPIEFSNGHFNHLMNVNLFKNNLEPQIEYQDANVQSNLNNQQQQQQQQQGPKIELLNGQIANFSLSNLEELNNQVLLNILNLPTHDTIDRYSEEEEAEGAEEEKVKQEEQEEQEEQDQQEEQEEQREQKVKKEKNEQNEEKEKEVQVKESEKLSKNQQVIFKNNNEQELSISKQNDEDFDDGQKVTTAKFESKFNLENMFQFGKRLQNQNLDYNQNAEDKDEKTYIEDNNNDRVLIKSTADELKEWNKYELGLKTNQNR